MSGLPRSCLLVMLVVLAGCAGFGLPQEDSDSKTNSTTTPESDHLRESKVFEYTNLSNESQQDFKRLLAARSMNTTDPLFSSRIEDEHYNLIYIRYNGTIYEIRHQAQRKEHRTCLQEVDQVNESTIGEDDQVGRYPHLSNTSQSLFDSIRTNASSSICYSPSEYPLTDYTHIKYNGSYYRLVELQGTVQIYKYRLDASAESSD